MIRTLVALSLVAIWNSEASDVPQLNFIPRIAYEDIVKKSLTWQNSVGKYEGPAIILYVHALKKHDYIGKIKSDESIFWYARAYSSRKITRIVEFQNDKYVMGLIKPDGSIEVMPASFHAEEAQSLFNTLHNSYSGNSPEILVNYINGKEN
jgi:hypothetical protein